MKVMIVEDSQAIRQRVVAMLKGIVGGDFLIEAGTATEAVRQMWEQKPDVVIVDLLLPDGNGLEVLMTIKAWRQSTRVLIMTNDPGQHYRKRALELGADHFFDKAREFHRVAEVIAEMAATQPTSRMTTEDNIT